MSVFQDLRVLDCSQGLVGPMAGMLLADFGAQVLKVEGPGGDRMKDHPGYLMWNRGKARLELDLAAERERLDALLAAADVVILDQPPDELAAMDLVPADLSARHPALIVLWAPPFGTSGPWSALPPHHAMLTGLTGTAFRQGSYRDQPVWHATPIAHYGQATMAASATAAALLQRAATGLGQSVTVSGAHGMAEVSGPISLIDVPGMQLHPLGGSPAYRLYECGDGEWLFLGTLFPHFFERAIDALDLAHARASAGEGGDVGGLIQHVFRQKPRAFWLEHLKAHDVPAAPVQDRRLWLGSEPMASNGMRLAFEHPERGEVEMPGIALKLAATPGSVRGLMAEATPEQERAFARPRPEPAAARVAEPPPAPLAGIRVLDLGTVIAGAYASAILGAFGAEVIKIESADGDPFRPFGMGFMNYNRGKRGLGLDLKSPLGRETFLDLARTADVVIDNYRLGVRQRLGIDYPVLRAVNPRIISLSINAYGSVGADAQAPGFDPLLQARSGMMAAQGGPGQEPVFHSIPVNDVATAAMASFGVIAALNARERTGEGQNIETCLAAQSAMFQAGELTAWLGSPPPPEGGRDCLGFAALDRYYRCGDGRWLTLACTAPEQLAGVAEALGGDDWTGRFAGPMKEVRDGPLAALIEAALAQRRRDEAVDALRAAGVPAAPVFRGDEAARQEWLWNDGYYELRSHPLWGDLITSRAYAAFSRGTCGFATLHPELGEHTVEVLLDYGIGVDRIRELAEAGVIFRG